MVFKRDIPSWSPREVHIGYLRRALIAILQQAQKKKIGTSLPRWRTGFSGSCAALTAVENCRQSEDDSTIHVSKMECLVRIPFRFACNVYQIILSKPITWCSFCKLPFLRCLFACCLFALSLFAYCLFAWCLFALCLFACCLCVMPLCVLPFSVYASLRVASLRYAFLRVASALCLFACCL